MAAESYILVFDHGTTSIRACLMDRGGSIVARAQERFPQLYPQPGWVEHEPNTLWEMTQTLCKQLLENAQVQWTQIAGVGLTNQRETVILWDKQTGQPIYNAIVWQCRRTADFCEQLKASNKAPAIREKTGLIIDAYFSASKIDWLLREVPEARLLLSENRLLFGTVDTWILWKLTGGEVHATDPTNASRTMLYNIHTQGWDEELLEWFGVPASILPTVHSSSKVVGYLDPNLTGGVRVPISGIAGDQQAALHGQKCWYPGMAKSTYGTGAFLVMNTGKAPVHSQQGLLTTLATDAKGQPAYALEGAIFFAGATLEWLHKKLDIIDEMRAVDSLATSISGNEGVYLVPAFAGLGAPYWDPEARAAIFGMTQDTGKAHLVRAALESMAYQTKAVLDAMQQEADLTLDALKIDGGVTRSNFMAQFLADILNVPVLRSKDPEFTARGAGYLAGLAVGFWPDSESIEQLQEPTERFVPGMPATERERLTQGWQTAIQKVLN